MRRQSAPRSSPDSVTERLVRPTLGRTFNPIAMKLLPIASWLTLAALAGTIALTATSNGRIGWDESAPILLGLGVLYLALLAARARATRNAGGPPAA